LDQGGEHLDVGLRKVLKRLLLVHLVFWLEASSPAARRRREFLRLNSFFQLIDQHFCPISTDQYETELFF
jgi:hypothetical protein